MQLSRYIIKNITSSQIADIANNCNRAAFSVSPSREDLWDVILCLKPIEFDRFKKLGFALVRTLG